MYGVEFDVDLSGKSAVPWRVPECCNMSTSSVEIPAQDSRSSLTTAAVEWQHNTIKTTFANDILSVNRWVREVLKAVLTE
mmetsp:Transcript_52293/g.96329  ORF Transcript_52293/g.96329 Transcript_52293/m.96329 type:complete len:80 (+) Transcript_52293:380-619(+)